MITRRRVLAGAAALAVAEALSLGGAFDHRAMERPTARARFAASAARLAAEDGVVHVGHSTHLIGVAGARFLTDPWFFDPAFGALAHARGPAAPPEEIGPLDAVLVTHDHPDHADRAAMDRLEKKCAIVATSELARAARRLRFGEAHVLRPGESIPIGRARVTAVQARHDVYEVGFVVEGDGRSVYFAGDTRLFDEMRDIRPTLAILPVDGTRVRGAGLHVMTPDDALRAAKLTGARTVIPSHAEARFSDPLAGALLATTIAGAAELFAEKARAAGIACALPAPGDFVPVA
jgi:L-ascorbate metabolism protein UlaG (beta-lactamase superfamily)